MSERALSALVLAAGEGTRMRSQIPKPLHPVSGRAMVLYVIDAVAACEVSRVVIVVGHRAEQVTKALQEQSPVHVEFVEQSVQRGTGDAVSVGLTAFLDDPDLDDDVLVLPGDTPLLRASTLAGLVATHQAGEAACTVLSARVEDPTGYGRVVRGRDDRVVRIVEHRDASPDELEIDEINTSIYCFRRSVLAPALRRVRPDNAQGEYYLTDVVEVLASAGYQVDAVVASDPTETEGVNDRAQLARSGGVLRRRTNDHWLASGVSIVDPDRTYIDATVDLGVDVTLLPGCFLQGRTIIAQGAEIGPDSHLVDCVVGEHAVVSKTVARDAEIGARAVVGPFAVLEPGAQIGEAERVAPFERRESTAPEPG